MPTIRLSRLAVVFPNARVFRQRKRGDWCEVVEGVRCELKTIVVGEPIVWPCPRSFTSRRSSDPFTSLRERESVRRAPALTRQGAVTVNSQSSVVRIRSE